MRDPRYFQGKVGGKFPAACGRLTQSWSSHGAQGAYAQFRLKGSFSRCLGCKLEFRALRAFGEPGRPKGAPLESGKRARFLELLPL